MAYNDIDSGKVLNKEGLLELSGQIKGYIEDNIPQAYTLPTASTTALGGVKVDGETITISDGVISATGSSGATYTAGTGISIDENNVISCQTRANFQPNPVWLAWLDSVGNTGYKESVTVTSPSQFLTYLAEGQVVYVENTMRVDLSELLDGYDTGELIYYNINTNKWTYSNIPNKTNFELSGDRRYFLMNGRLCAFHRTAGSSYNLFASLIPIVSSSVTAHSVFTAIEELATTKLSIPEIPTDDGNYKLTSTVASGTATYAWEANTGGSGSGFSGDYNDLINKPTIPSAYTLPTATTATLGGVKVDGETITINDGVISAVGGGDTTKIINVTTLANILEDEALDTALQEIQTTLHNGGTVNYVVYLDNILATPIGNSNNTYPKLRILNNGKFLNYTPTSANGQVYYYSTTNYALDSSNVSVPTANQIGSKYTVAETFGYIKTNYATKDYVDVKVPDISTTATDGIYKLTSTITSGSPTYAWEEDSGNSGGGTTYTAGSGIDITNNVISTTGQFSGDYNDLSNKPTIPAAYTLPTATTSTLGGVKVDGETITIADGVISAASNSSGSGGATYTAGTGIDIDSNNVISNNIFPMIAGLTAPQPPVSSAGDLFHYNGNINFVQSYGILEYRNDIVQILKQCKIVYIAQSPYSNSSSDSLRLRQDNFLNDGTTNIKYIKYTDSNYIDYGVNNDGYMPHPNEYLYWDGSRLHIWNYAGNIIRHMKINSTDTLGRAINNINTRIPPAPTTDGDYVLKVSVSSGTPTYSWVAATTGGSY